MDIAALKTIGAWTGLVTTLVVIMMAFTGIIKLSEVLFFGAGILIGILFAAFAMKKAMEAPAVEETFSEDDSEEKSPSDSL